MALMPRKASPNPPTLISSSEVYATSNDLPILVHSEFSIDSASPSSFKYLLAIICETKQVHT